MYYLSQPITGLLTKTSQLFSGRVNIETEDTLSKTDIERIQKLNLLDKDEKIYKFYSEFKNKVAGNFFTDRRIAKYWIDENDKTKDVTVFAFYQDIKSIATFIMQMPHIAHTCL